MFFVLGSECCQREGVLRVGLSAIIGSSAVLKGSARMPWGDCFLKGDVMPRRLFYWSSEVWRIGIGGDEKC